MTVTVIGDNTSGPDYAGTEDGQFKENSSGSNYGSSATMEITHFQAGDETRVLLGFSGLSNIDSGEEVSAATVSIYLASYGTTYGAIFRRVLLDWVESQFTWDNFANGGPNTWTAGGCGSDGNDRASAGGDVGNLAESGGYDDLSATQITTDTEDFVDGTHPNYGWVIQRSDAGTGGFRTYATSDGTDSQLPYITVTHTTPAGGGIEVLRRRREGY